MAKSYEELEFTDDFMFGKVMEDKELCHDVLECLLQEPVGTLQDVQTEQGFQYTSDGKPIRLDVYTKDTNTIYDAEMQNLNHKKIETLALPKRSRFYQSTMDVDFLQKGTLYQDLPDSLRDLYNYVSTGKANNSLTRRIETAIKKVKSNEKWRSESLKQRSRGYPRK